MFVKFGFRWEKIRDSWLFWYERWIWSSKIRQDYLKITQFLASFPDYWRDGENQLLLRVEKEAGEGWR